MSIFASIFGTGESGSSSGDVVGPSSAIGDDIVLFNGTTGKLLKDSGVQITPVDDATGFVSGLSLQRQELTVVSSGTSVYLDVQRVDGGDIDYWIDGTKYTLDCTTGSGVDGKARIELVQGTATSPRANSVYVAYDEQLDSIALSTTPPESAPMGNFAPVAIVTIQDYTGVTANGPLVLQRTTETISHNGKGAVSWEREKLRALGAQYWSGIDQSLEITSNSGSEDDIDFAVTGGTVFQLHRQQLDPVNVSTDGIMVANSQEYGGIANYTKFTNLNGVNETIGGSELNDGDSFILIIWGSVNYGGENKLFVNLPSDKYTNDDEAINDINKTAITTIPAQFRTTGYLIAKLVLKYTSTDNGTWSNLLTEPELVWKTGYQTTITPNFPSNYTNNHDDYIGSSIIESGALKIKVYFDQFNTEANYDYIYLRNNAGTTYQTYHGNLGSFISGEVPGDTVKIFFHSDGSVTRSGVRTLSYDYQISVAAGSEVVDLRGIPTGFNLGASGGSTSSPWDSVDEGINYSSGNVGMGVASPDTKVDIDGALTLREQSLDPSNPDEGGMVMWVSDGTGSGDDGDVMLKITAGSVTKTVTLVDYSAS